MAKKSLLFSKTWHAATNFVKCQTSQNVIHHLWSLHLTLKTLVVMQKKTVYSSWMILRCHMLTMTFVIPRPSTQKLFGTRCCSSTHIRLWWETTIPWSLKLRTLSGMIGWSIFTDPSSILANRNVWGLEVVDTVTGRSSTPNVEGLPDLADLPDLVIPDVDKTALWLGDCGVLVGQVHTHPITMNWWMAGGTCHPINQPYEITAALLESSCATASSPIYLNWSAPHMSSHTSWKIRSSTLN